MSFFAIRITILIADKVLKRRPYFAWMLQLHGYDIISFIVSLGLVLDLKETLTEKVRFIENVD